MAETPLITYLKIQRATDRQILDALRVSAGRIDLELKRLNGKTGVGNQMRRQQVMQSKAVINRELGRLWSDVGDTVEAARANAAASGAETILRESKDVLLSVLPAEDYAYMLDSARASASQAVEALSQRVSGSSYVPLSESVYNNAALSSGKVDDIVNAALARGASAAELAREVRGFVNPNTPGGVRYASLRLARTEINNAFHAAQIKQAQDEPWTTALLWNLSGSHPKPDECNQYADDVHFRGGEPGQWKPEEVPAKPHPNCLCYTTPEAMSEEEFVDSFIKGDFDSYLDDELGVELPPAEDRPFPEFSKLSSPQSYAESAKLVNPGPARQEYRNNCHFVTSSMEMRARGFDVVASPTFRSIGRHEGSIARDWIDPSTGRAPRWRGMARIQPRSQGLTPAQFKAARIASEKVPMGEVIEGYLQDWPPGARGIVSGEWTRGGGGHVFNVYKDENGVLRYVDGQVGKVDAARYLDEMKLLKILRLDNAEPVPERIKVLAEPKVLDVTDKKVQLRKAEQLLKQFEEDTLNLSSRESYITDIFDLKRKIKTLQGQIKKG